MHGLWRIEMLGCLRASRGTQIVRRFRRQTAGVLLAYLAYYRHRSHPREALIEMLWPECDPPVGRNRLRVALCSLRRQLEPPGVPAGTVFLEDGANLQLHPAVCDTDVAAFESGIEAAAQSSTLVARAQHLTEAVRCYQGELLPGAYQEWVLRERQRLAEACQQALQQLSAHLKQADDLPGALDCARRAVAMDPLREEAQHEFIRLLAAAGRVQATLRQYRELERILAQELGAAPSAEIQAFVRSFHWQQTVPLREGQKRGSLPRIDRHPATPSGTAAEAVHSSRARATCEGYLPLPLSLFFGREDEIDRLCGLLKGSNATGPRLLTLTGPGGSGKTRLALEIAARLSETWRGAIWFVPLADLTESRLLPGAVRDAVRLPPTPGVEPLEQLTAALSHRPTLLLLDNFEHLVDEGATIVYSLLQRVANLTCLVTSRRPLRLAGEREFLVTPLPIPAVSHGRPEAVRTPESLMQYPSVQLFVDRAQAVCPDFQVTPRCAAAVGALCRRLEGIPLALELAGARARVLTPEQMLDHLSRRFDLLVSGRRDLAARHRSLRAALEWSHDLLPAELQRFFARLSVFRGGWTLAAAEVVCEEPRALDSLEQLRECSLVLAEEGSGKVRFRMLETLREYAQQQLAPSDCIALPRRHAATYLALAETFAESHLMGADQVAWLDRLEEEHDNLRAALDWSVETGETEVGLRLGGALQEFWEVRVHWSEGRERLARLLARTTPSERTAVRAKALRCAGTMAYSRAELSAGRALLGESLSICRALGNKAEIAAALHSLAHATVRQEDAEAPGRSFESAGFLFEESLALRRELGDRPAFASSLQSLAFLAFRRGDYPVAQRLYEESLETWRELGYKWGMHAPLHGLAGLAYQRGDLEVARALLQESLAIRREIGDTPNVKSALLFLARIIKDQGDYETAQAAIEEGLAMSREMGVGSEIVEGLQILGEIVQQQGKDRWAISLFAEGVTLSKEHGNKAGIAHCLVGLAGVTGRRGEMERAARMLGAAAALVDPLAAAWWQPDRARYEQRVAAVRSQLCMEEEAFAAASAAGRRMTLEEAAAYALDARVASSAESK